MISQEQIQQVKETIVREFNPDKIVLFGSYAYGEPTENSDLDLLVVLNHNKPRNSKQAGEIRRQFRGSAFPMDIIVYKPEEVEEWKYASAAFVTSIFREGKILYENK